MDSINSLHPFSVMNDFSKKFITYIFIEIQSNSLWLMITKVNMKINIVILCVLFFLFMVSASAEPLHVSLSTIPAVPTGKFIGQVTAADFDSTMPNPCYKVTNCYIASFVISKDWLPEGQQGYTSWDTVNHKKRRELAFDAVTMGELLKKLRDANLLFISMTDYLPSSKGKNPTFCRGSRFNRVKNHVKAIIHCLN